MTEHDEIISRITLTELPSWNISIIEGYYTPCLNDEGVITVLYNGKEKVKYEVHETKGILESGGEKKARFLTDLFFEILEENNIFDKDRFDYTIYNKMLEKEGIYV